jgi:DNA polymerase-3 subunit delta'
MIYPWQQGLWEMVQRARQDNHLPHALLFTGENGCGNGDFIETLAQSLLCLTPASDGMPCGHCRSCQVFAAQAHPDFARVGLQEERQAILIEQIRDLNHFLGLSRSYSPLRVAVIAPAERMNVNAANSLLKSLEEPAANTHILLLTDNPGSLLPTIRSRCQVMRLPLPAKADALAWLGQQSLQHSAEVLLEAAYGRPLEAVRLDSSATLAQRQQWFEALEKIRQGNGNVVELSAQWEKHDKLELLDWQLAHVHVLMTRDMSALAEKRQLWQKHEKLLELKRLATHPLNPRLFIESMLMLWQETN